MSTLGNIIWFVFGGLFMSLEWAICGVLAFISIIGIPWGRACFMLANFTLFPFGRMVVDRKELTGKDDLGTGVLGMAGNIVWFVLLGWVLALSHIFFGVFLCVTVIGIPFGIQHFKLAAASLFPVGKTVVDNATLPWS